MNQPGTKEIFTTFLRLGLIAFGGPVAHVGLMEEVLVKEKKWLDSQTFLDLMSVSNLIPGPNSTELAIGIGYRLGGVKGLLAAGSAFILPAMTIVMGFALLYVRYGTMPLLTNILTGIQPVVLAIILSALLRLVKKTMTEPLAYLLAGLLVVWQLVWQPQEVLLLLGGAALYFLAKRVRANRLRAVSLLPLSVLFATFVKIGALLFGSGYVLIAFLQTEFVDRLGVLTSKQLLDAVALGQVKPGPLFTTATFVGTILSGPVGGLVATVGIFLPSFLLVGIIMPFAQKLRASKKLSLLLDGINIASLALFTAVTLRLVPEFIRSPVSVGVFLLSAWLVIKKGMKAHWMILGGALFGVLLSLF